MEQFFRDAAVSHRHLALPVLDERGQLRGLVTLQHLRAVPAEARDTTRLHQVACPVEKIAMTEPEEPLALVLPRMPQSSRGRMLAPRHHLARRPHPRPDRPQPHRRASRRG